MLESELLGLLPCMGLVKQIGGFTAVESQVNVGTTFDIYFPRVEEQHSLLTAEEKAYDAPVSTTVLVVEDERTVENWW